MGRGVAREKLAKLVATAESALALSEASVQTGDRIRWPGVVPTEVLALPSSVPKPPILAPGLLAPGLLAPGLLAPGLLALGLLAPGLLVLGLLAFGPLVSCYSYKLYHPDAARMDGMFFGQVDIEEARPEHVMESRWHMFGLYGAAPYDDGPTWTGAAVSRLAGSIDAPARFEVHSSKTAAQVVAETLLAFVPFYGPIRGLVINWWAIEVRAVPLSGVPDPDEEAAAR